MERIRAVRRNLFSSAHGDLLIARARAGALSDVAKTRLALGVMLVATINVHRANQMRRARGKKCTTIQPKDGLAAAAVNDEDVAIQTYILASKSRKHKKDRKGFNRGRAIKSREHAEAKALAKLEKEASPVADESEPEE